MPSLADERLELRIPPGLKDRIRQAALARGQTITRFALDSLAVAADSALRSNPSAARSLGWAAGTAEQHGDLIAPAIDLDDWEALRG